MKLEDVKVGDRFLCVEDDIRMAYSPYSIEVIDISPLRDYFFIRHEWGNLPRGCWWLERSKLEAIVIQKLGRAEYFRRVDKVWEALEKGDGKIGVGTGG